MSNVEALLTPNASELKTLSTKVSVVGQGKVAVELCLICDHESNAVFAVESSFVEQEAGPIKSPYSGATIVLPEGDAGEANEPDCLRRIFGGGDAGRIEGHPVYPRIEWRKHVLKGATDLGYWEWVSARLKTKRVRS